MILGNQNAPIGIFDSGIGGLTVANAVCKALPHEHIIYFGDTAHLPYGDKSPETIQRYSLQITEFLLSKGCKMVIVACNSASAAAFPRLKEVFGEKVLLLDVIEPLVEAVAEQHFKKVGVIATKATISSGVYTRQLNEASPETEVAALATPLLVPMIEEGFFQNEISHAIIAQYLSNECFAGIDALLLSCTHYPLIKREISAFWDDKVRIYDSTDVVTQKTRKMLAERGLLNPSTQTPSHQFYVSDLTPSFEKTTKLFYGREIHLERMRLG